MALPHFYHLCLRSAKSIVAVATATSVGVGMRRRKRQGNTRLQCQSLSECPGEVPHLSVRATARACALHSLLTDLSVVDEARKVELLFPKLLEWYWAELRHADFPISRVELMLQSLAFIFSHGTLRLDHIDRLGQVLRTLDVCYILDPLANTGFHANLLALRGGIRTTAADIAPSRRCWMHVTERPLRCTDWHNYGNGWALFLSWLPHWNDIGFEALRQFQGNVLVVLGDHGDWTGTKRFHEELGCNWTLVESWETGTPWPRVRETLSIFIRSKHQCRSDMLE